MRARAFSLLIGASALVATAVVAQIEGGDRGVAPIDSSGDYEVSGIAVDVSGKTADAARYGGWRIAQRKAWQQLAQRLGGTASSVADSTLDSVVSAIVVENEQIGPTRYIARLGVLFNRARAAGLLGVASSVVRSPPMVVIPVMWSGGTGTAFEQRTPWQEAWARYRTGNSTVDYIRPSGTGPDPLLLNYGQATRPGRGWWRTVLDQYGGTDVLIPTVKLYRQWPGGPIIGVFQARQGPDNQLLRQFTLRVGSAAGLPALLDAGVRRLDDAYQAALRGGYLKQDPGLAYTPPTDQPTDAGLSEDALSITNLPVVTTQIDVQFDSPNAGAVNATELAMRGVPGVASAATSSLALGGVSVMRVGFAGDPLLFKSALEARGWQVLGQGTTLRIRRAPQLLPPDIQPAPPTAG